LKKFSIYSKSSNDGYPNTTRRFELIKKIEDFNTILDFGSGPCSLLKWINENNINCSYEAYDTRRDSLDNHCNCTTHYDLPIHKKYDLVCILGVSGLNTEINTIASKNLFVKTFQKACSLSSKYVLFNTSFQDKYPNYIVNYSEDEIIAILNENKLKIIFHDMDPDFKENIYMCSF
jgi:hypothetical protein